MGIIRHRRVPAKILLADDRLAGARASLKGSKACESMVPLSPNAALKKAMDCSGLDAVTLSSVSLVPLNASTTAEGILAHAANRVLPPAIGTCKKLSVEHTYPP